MPYIKQDKRIVLDPFIDNLHKALVDLEVDDENNNMEGNLNYIITRLLRICYGNSYKEINDAMGVLTCVMMEHYRTIAAPYEEQKKFDNGDVVIEKTIEKTQTVIVEEKNNDTGC